MTIKDTDLIILNGVLGAIKALKVQGKVDEALLDGYKSIVKKIEDEYYQSFEDFYMKFELASEFEVAVANIESINKKIGMIEKSQKRVENKLKECTNGK